MAFMIQKILLLIGLSLIFSQASQAIENTNESDPESQAELSFNPRDDYRFGVGTLIGGPLGVVGIVADMNWYSLVNAEVGAGSGIYFDSYVMQGRYLVLDNALTPYLGVGLAYWDSTSNGPKMAQNSEPAVKLGLVKEDGTDLRGGLVLLPLSLGIHYMADNGLTLFADFEFIISSTNLNGLPYGALGLQWFF